MRQRLLLLLLLRVVRLTSILSTVVAQFILVAGTILPQVLALMKSTMFVVSSTLFSSTLALTSTSTSASATTTTTTTTAIIVALPAVGFLFGRVREFLLLTHKNHNLFDPYSLQWRLTTLVIHLPLC